MCFTVLSDNTPNAWLLMRLSHRNDSRGDRFRLWLFPVFAVLLRLHPNFSPKFGGRVGGGVKRTRSENEPNPIRTIRKRNERDPMAKRKRPNIGVRVCSGGWIRIQYDRKTNLIRSLRMIRAVFKVRIKVAPNMIRTLRW